VEESIRRSRFLTTIGPAPDEASARSFIEAIRREFPDATHNCWAFMAGPPGSTARVGMSDDGEPHGTAGRPILQTLLHSGLGEVVAVVTRYYGGVKLGTGGLGRAYAGGVKLALESLPTEERVARVPVVLAVGYGAAEGARRLLIELEGRILEEHWADGARFQAEIPEVALAELERRLADLTSGEGRLDLETPD
jgi:uncharacterized YigZ family protein